MLAVRLEDEVHGGQRKARAPLGARRRGRAPQARLDRRPDRMTVRRRTVEHVFGTLKHWMGSTHFLTRRLENVST